MLHIAIPTQLVHPPNPFRGNFAKLLRTYDLWKQVLDHWLGDMNKRDPESTEPLAGLAIDALVLSSILHGGYTPGLLLRRCSAPSRTRRIEPCVSTDGCTSSCRYPGVESGRRISAVAAGCTDSDTVGNHARRSNKSAAGSELSCADGRSDDVELAKRVKDRIDAHLKQTQSSKTRARGLDRLLQAVISQHIPKFLRS